MARRTRGIAAARGTFVSKDRRTLRGGALVAVAVLALGATFGLRDARRSGPEPVGSCADYVGLVETCMGRQTATRLAAAFAKPPRDDAARARMEKECVASRERLEKACR